MTFHICRRHAGLALGKRLKIGDLRADRPFLKGNWRTSSRPGAGKRCLIKIEASSE